MQQEQRKAGLGRDAGHAGIHTCAPRVPSTDSKLTYTGWPSRPNPTGTFASPISSKYSAWSRCSPVARFHVAPGIGGEVNLGLDPGDRNLRDLGDLGRQRALLDQEHIRRGTARPRARPPRS